MPGGSCVSSGEKLATEDMNAGTARDDTKLASCPCKDPTCPQGHGSRGCSVRMTNLCATCKAHKDKQPKK
ncbi:hypothetical protein LA080_014288 [Diaporthe eres]|nr:hypothetical protein LA080_014288 [Diaporthe eres]